MAKTRVPIVLSIAGSDSGAGAGIQADLLTFHALGVYGATAVTAVTAQNRRGVRNWAPVPPRLVQAQIRAVFEDLRPAAVKTGMLGSEGVAGAVARTLARLRVRRLVVDPIIRAGTGARLLDQRAFAVLKSRLLPLATLATPNLPEAEALAGFKVRSAEDRRQAALAIAALGPRAVLITGGHGRGRQVSDLLFDGRRFIEFLRPRLPVGRTHGTGCVLSAAIAAHLALGVDLETSVEHAITFVRRRLVLASRLNRRHAVAGQLPLVE